MSDVVAMTYSELAQRRGISVASARRMVTRRKWGKTKGNDGLARINVPIGAVPEVEPVAETAPTTPDLLAWAMQRADAAELRADAAEARLAELQGRYLADHALLIERLRPWWVRWRRLR